MRPFPHREASGKIENLCIFCCSAQQKLHKFWAGACGTSCANLSFQGERVDRGADGAGEWIGAAARKNS